MRLTAKRGRIVKRKKNGGAVVEIPIMTEGEVTPATASQAPKKGVKIDREFLRQVAANWGKRPGPVPVYTGHPPQEIRDMIGAIGYITKVELRGNTLWATIDLTPEGAIAVADNEMFRGFSVEMEKDPVYSTGKVEGWVITGGGFTNDPALDVEFAIAATRWAAATEGEAEPAALLTVSRLEFEAANDGGQPVSDNKDRNGDGVATVKLTEQLKALKEQNLKLAADNKRLLEIVERQEKERTAERIKAAIAAGIKEFRITPAMVEGYDKDPIAWLEASPYKDAEAVERWIASMPENTFREQKIAAGKPKAEEGSEDPLELINREAMKLSAEKNLTYPEAIDLLRATKPELWRKAGLALAVKEG